MNIEKMTDKYEYTDNMLNELKRKFVESACEDGHISYDFLRNDKIFDSELYSFVKKIPKGGECHVHGVALLPPAELIGLVSSLDGLCISTDKSKAGFLSRNNRTDEFISYTEAIKQGIYSVDELKKMWSLEGAGSDKGAGTDEDAATDGDLWQYMEKLFDAHSVLGDDEEYLIAYYKEAFKYYIANNVDYIEVRTFFFGTKEEAVNKAKALRQAYYETRNEHPGFTVRIIALTLKYKTVPYELLKSLADNACEAALAVMDETDEGKSLPFITGFDMVNEEDESRTIDEMSEIISYVREKVPMLKFAFHAGETLKPGNHNIAYALKQGAVRIGHGYDLFEHKELIEQIKEQNVALEICPVSNHILGYCHDLSAHPARNYYNDGINIVIASDDPAYQEHTSLVDDYFAVIMNWDLNIRDIKKLSMNSIRYALTDDETKRMLLGKLESKWEEFLDNICK